MGPTLFIQLPEWFSRIGHLCSKSQIVETSSCFLRKFRGPEFWQMIFLDLFKVTFFSLPWWITIKPPFGMICVAFSRHLIMQIQVFDFICWGTWLLADVELYVAPAGCRIYCCQSLRWFFLKCFRTCEKIFGSIMWWLARKGLTFLHCKSSVAFTSFSVTVLTFFMWFNAYVCSLFVCRSMKLRTSALTRRSLLPNELLSVWRHWRSIFHARNPSMTQRAESSSEMSCLWVAFMSSELAAAVWPANMSSLDHAASSGWYPTTTTSFQLQTPPGLKISVVIPSSVIVCHISAISWCVIVGSCLKTWILTPVEGGFIFQPTFRRMNPNEHVELNKFYSYAIFHSAWRLGWGHFLRPLFQVFWGGSASTWKIVGINQGRGGRICESTYGDGDNWSSWKHFDHVVQWFRVP